MLLKYIERTRSLMSNLNQIQEMTHRYWEEYSLDFTVCSQQHQQEEIDFLVQKFVDNGDQKHELFRILNKFQRKTSNPPPTPSENTDQTQIVVTLGTWAIKQPPPCLDGWFQDTGVRLQLELQKKDQWSSFHQRKET